MNILQSLLVYFVSPLIGFLIIILFAYMIFSWLIAFNIVNLRNPAMNQVYTIVNNIAEPIIRPFRRFIPPMGGLDLAFLAAILVLYWLKGFAVPALYNLLG